MNILIIGGSGFIGTRLVADLLKNENNKVKIFDKVVADKHKNYTLIGDVRNGDQLTKACEGIDVIYNLAAEHADNVTPQSLYAEVNINGAENIVNAAIVNGIKSIIFTSSVAIYGLNRGTPNEEMEAKPFNEYGRTKFEAEKIFLDWAKRDGTNSLTILRPAVVFGEHNRGNVFNLLQQVTSRKFLMVGTGNNFKSMTYVGNISTFLSQKTRAKEGVEIFNFADKPDLNSANIIQIIKNEMNITYDFISIPYFMGLLAGYTFDILSFVTRKKFPVSSVRIKKFCAETTVNTERLSESGFKAPFTTEEGLRRMIRHEFK